MKKVTILCIALFQLVSALYYVTAKQQTTQRTAQSVATKNKTGEERAWGTATYRGVTVGKSKRADVYRVFGKPKWIDKWDKEDHEYWYNYEGVGELPGKFTVMIDTREQRVIGMTLAPDNLSKDEAIKHFGEGYIITKYDFCPGFKEQDSGHIYESPGGEAVYIEYRSRGIALLVNYMNKVDEILYVNEPIGLASKKDCPTGTRKTGTSVKGRR